MKNLNYALILIFSLFLTQALNAQFVQITGTSNDSWGFSSSGVNRIGIGIFPSSTDLTSALEINGNLTPSTTGEVFRTIGKASTSTYWRMFRDVSGTPTEYGKIYNNNDPHFYVQSVNGSGDLYLGVNAAATALTVKNTSGNVGINSASPAYKLDVTGDINIASTQVYRIAGKPALTSTAIIIKATDSDDYYEITVNKKGKLKATLIKRFNVS